MKEFTSTAALMENYRQVRHRLMMTAPQPKKEEEAVPKIDREQMISELRSAGYHVERQTKESSPVVAFNLSRLILRFVCRDYGCRESDIKGKGRVATLTVPRQMFCYLCRELTHLSTPQIGRIIGNRDHTTVMHAIAKTGRQISEDEEFATRVERIATSVIAAATETGIEIGGKRGASAKYTPPAQTAGKTPLAVAELIELLRTYPPDALVMIDCVDVYYSGPVTLADVSEGTARLVAPHDGPKYRVRAAADGDIVEMVPGGVEHYPGGWTLKEEARWPVSEQRPCVIIYLD